MRTLLTLLSCASIALVSLCSPSYAASQNVATKAPQTTAAAARSKIEKGERRHAPLSRVRPHRSPSRFSAEGSAASPRIETSHATAGPHREAAYLPNLRGAVIRSSAWTEDSSQPGIYQIMSNGVMSPCFSGPQYGFALPAGDIYYDVYAYFITDSYAWVTYNPYNIETGEKLATFDAGAGVAAIPIDGTVDPTTGKIYAICFNDNGTSLNLSTLEFTEHSVSVSKVGDLSGTWCALACDPQGQLYAISQTIEGETCTGSQLYKLDKSNAATTLIGDTGQLPYYQTSATFDPRSGTMYWTVSPKEGTSFLCNVDLTTGTATKIVDFLNAEEIVGLYVEAPLAEDKAPAEATITEVSFAEGSLSGTVSFKAPDTLFDGTPASGDVNYTVSANGRTVASGTTQYGADVNLPLTLNQSGPYSFIVYLTNETGDSPQAKYSCHIGFGTPKQATATLQYSEGTATVTWDAVTATTDGGYINPEAVTYKVIRYPDTVVVADGLAATTFSETLPEPESLTMYYYTVTAQNGGTESAPARTNKISLGNIVPPYINDFSDIESLEPFTIINANEDNQQWGFSSDRLSIGYNGSKAMDDWIISPAMHLEGGKAYKFSFKAIRGGSYAERVEAKWGSAPTVEGMTNELIAPFEITTEMQADHLLSNYFVPQQTGTYYVGIHGISDPDKYYLFVDDFAIENGFSGAVPAQVTDVVIAPDPDGGKSVDISFTTPDTTFNGDPLTAITAVDLLRDGNLLKKFDNPGIAEKLTFTDNLEEEGYVTYTIAVWNESGMSEYYTKTVFIGIDAPAAPANIKLSEEGDSGKITLTWDAVTTDRNGQDINPELISYDIARYDAEQEGWVAFTDRITSTSYTFQALTGTQRFVQYAVFAHTKGGYNAGISRLTPVGTSYSEIVESFPNQASDCIWANGYSEQDGSWLILADNFGIPSQDNDNGLAAMKGFFNGATCALISGKLSLKDAANPGIRLYVYNLLDEKTGEADDTNEVQIFVSEVGSDEWIPLIQPVAMNSLSQEEGWQMLTASLADYKGKTIQIRIQGTTRVYFYTYLDNIRIGDLPDYDLAAVGFSAPAKATTGTRYSVSAEISNVGMKDAAGFSVELYENDRLVDSRNVESLKSGKTTKVDFERIMDPVADKAVALYAKINYSQDENTANNVTAKSETAPVYTRLPAVTDLKATDSENGVSLTWSRPDVESASRPNGDEDFENTDSWAHQIDFWTFIDRDNSPVGGFQQLTLPGIAPGSSTASFFVFDTSDGDFGRTLAAHSGNKFLAALFRYDDGQTDDWAISPMLDGSAQTISFWARSYSNDFREKIEMLYSTGSLDPDDFTLVRTVEAVPGKVTGTDMDPQPEWNEYDFDVPQGAKYFAIRSCATGSFMLQMDDFSFKPGDQDLKLVINGYNIYRDRELITDKPVDTTAFLDGNAAEGKHDYMVVTVYETGVSAPSNVATVSRSGMPGIGSDNIRIVSGKGRIIITGAQGLQITVNDITGKTIRSAQADSMEIIPVSAGVYVVTAGNHTAKVIVR